MWKAISDDARMLVKSLLKINPKSRPTAKEALKHPWFKVRRVPRCRSISQPPAPIKVFPPIRSPNHKALRTRDNSPKGRENRHIIKYDQRRDLNGSVLKRRNEYEGLASAMRSKLIQI